MGKLTLPRSGLVYLDTSPVIYSVEKIEPYHTLLQPMWQAAQTGDFILVSSELLLLETLVKPIQDANVVLEQSFRNLLLTSHEMQLVRISLPILETATQLRATTRIKTPDAIHVATALMSGCALFITNDKGLRHIPGLSVVVLSDLVP